MNNIRLLVAAALFLLCSIGMTSCTANDEPSKRSYDDVPLVILDTDIGSSTDDLFALEMLYYYQNQGRCKLLGVVVDRMGEKSAANLISAIDRSREAGLARLLCAFGIRQVGQKAAKVLATYYPDLDSLMAATHEELTAVPDIGSITADWFSLAF